MRVLFPFVGDSVGGSHRSAIELIHGLKHKGVEVSVILHQDGGPLSEVLLRENIRYLCVPVTALAGEAPNVLRIMLDILRNFYLFSRFIVTNEIDVVHGNDLRVNLSWALPAKIYAKGFIWHQRTVLSSSKLWLLINYLCSYFVAISDVVMQGVPKNIPDNKKRVVYNPFDINTFISRASARNYTVQEYKIPENSFLLGAVGRIVEYKNIGFVIKNFYKIYNNINKNSYLIIVGTGDIEYLNELKASVYELGLNERVLFTGFVNNPDKIVASLDLLVASSCVDAFGRTVVEAMLQKTPVLAAKSGGHIDIVEEGVNGWFYDPAVKDDFIGKVSAIMNSQNINTVTDSAYEYAKVNFSSQQHLNNMHDIYMSLLSN